MKRKGLTSVLLCLAATSVMGGKFDLSWHSIDGGGVIRSTGGEFELSGTIGQPDAGLLAGGDIELSGGFWFALTPTDCNEDGAVNLFDHGSLLQCLGGPDGGVLSGCECFDVDRGGAVDLHDVAAMQVAFIGS